MIKCRKQLRGVTALLGLEYRGKAAFIFACFQRQTVLYFEQRPSTRCSSNPRIPCGLCRRSLGSAPAIYSLNLRILRGYHRRVSVKPSGCLLLESSDSLWVRRRLYFFADKKHSRAFYGKPGSVCVYLILRRVILQRALRQGRPSVPRQRRWR